MAINPTTITDPVERIVADALDRVGVVYQTHNSLELDFYLPSYEIYIEVKQYHSPRISEQMSRNPNVIAIQGIEAARAFADLLLLDF